MISYCSNNILLGILYQICCIWTVNNITDIPEHRYRSYEQINIFLITCLKPLFVLTLWTFVSIIIDYWLAPKVFTKTTDKQSETELMWRSCRSKYVGSYPEIQQQPTTTSYDSWSTASSYLLKWSLLCYCWRKISLPLLKISDNTTYPRWLYL